MLTSHLRPYLDGIMDVIIDFRLPSGEKNGRATSAILLRSAVEGLGREMENYVPNLLRHFVSFFSEDDSEDRQATLLALDSISLLGAQLEDNIYSVVSAVVAVFSASDSDTPFNVRKQAIEALEALIRQRPVSSTPCAQ